MSVENIRISVKLNCYQGTQKIIVEDFLIETASKCTLSQFLEKNGNTLADTIHLHVQDISRENIIITPYDIKINSKNILDNNDITLQNNDELQILKVFKGKTPKTGGNCVIC